MFESVDGRTDGRTDARTPARVPSYKLTLPRNRDDALFPIITLWELSVAMETRVLI